MIDPKLAGRVVLVTGVNNPPGIGAATARGLAAEGALWLTGQLLYVGGGWKWHQ